jgi:general secretion pathway protein D
MTRVGWGAVLALAVLTGDAHADQQGWPPAGASPVPTPTIGTAAQLSFRFAAGTGVAGILRFLAESGGVNLVLESTIDDRVIPSAISLDDVTLEQALDLVLTTNNLFYTALDSRTILVAPDTLQNRRKYEQQVIRTFRLRNAQAADLVDLLVGSFVNPLLQRPVPQIQPDKVANTLTVRGSPSAVAIAQRIIEDNDLPRAEVVVDVQILEVDRARAKAFGLNLATFMAGIQYAPNGLGSSQAPGGDYLQPGTLLAGASATDFYLTHPQLVIRLLEMDAHTQVLAKPSLRGSDGATQTVRFGDEIPVPSTTFQSVSSGPGAVSGLSAFTYRPVGISISVTPRVTADDDVVLELEVESSTRAADVNVAGQNLPSFGTRKVHTSMRLRNGESSMLAGLIRDDDRRLIAGLPGVIHVPVVRELFSANLGAVVRTDVVMLVTPHIVRDRDAEDRSRTAIVIRRP